MGTTNLRNGDIPNYNGINRHTYTPNQNAAREDEANEIAENVAVVKMSIFCAHFSVHFAWAIWLK